jgi:hypothetical protein
MPPVRITLPLGQPADFTRRFGAAVSRTPAGRLTRTLGIWCEVGLVGPVGGTEEN